MKTCQNATGTSSLPEPCDAEECQWNEANWLAVTWQPASRWIVPLRHQPTESAVDWLSDRETTQPDSARAPIREAREYMEQHCRDELSLDHVAQALRVPVSRLDQLLLETMGLAFQDFVARVRVEKAKNLLLNPNYSFTEIAFELGFGSIREFNRLFTRMVGEPPTAYRDRLNCSRLR